MVVRGQIHARPALPPGEQFQIPDVEMMDDERIPEILIKYNPSDNRDPGRPQQR
jgi:hypothetical protein